MHSIKLSLIMLIMAMHNVGIFRLYEDLYSHCAILKTMQSATVAHYTTTVTPKHACTCRLRQSQGGYGKCHSFYWLFLSLWFCFGTLLLIGQWENA